MEYVARLLQHEKYQETVQAIKALEADRIYCRHNMEHFMDVARLAQIRNLKEQLGIEEEMIYLYALLHDIGRRKEYEEGISHAKASAEFAGEIFVAIEYPKEKADIICKAILAHRREMPQENGSPGLKGQQEFVSQALKKGQENVFREACFIQLMKWADKASRMCFACDVSDGCKWKAGEKNKPENWF